MVAILKYSYLLFTNFQVTYEKWAYKSNPKYPTPEKVVKMLQYEEKKKLI